MSSQKCGCGCSSNITAENFIEAEKLILAGIILRLGLKYMDEYGEKSGKYAAAVAGYLFDIPPQSDEDAAFTKQNEATINLITSALSAEHDICDILTQTFIMRVVYASRLSGCKTENLYGSIEKLKSLGLYLETGNPPTPQNFFKNAESFFLASQKS